MLSLFVSQGNELLLSILEPSVHTHGRIDKKDPPNRVMML